MLQKNTAPLVGPLFCGGPCLAEHAEHAWIRRWPYIFVADSFHTKRSAILTEIGSFAVFSPLWGLRGNVR